VHYHFSMSVAILLPLMLEYEKQWNLRVRWDAAENSDESALKGHLYKSAAANREKLSRNEEATDTATTRDR
jgi:hypothetical protein